MAPFSQQRNKYYHEKRPKMHLKSEAERVIEATLGQAATKRGLTPFEAELAGPSGLLALVTPPGPYPPTLPRLLLSRHLAPQIVQAQKAVRPTPLPNPSPIGLQIRISDRALKELQGLRCGNGFAVERVDEY
jgi:hypothetical protein